MQITGGKMFILGPSDAPVNDSKSDMTHTNFGGRRQVTEGVEKSEDYTRPSLERRANMSGETDEKIFNPVEDATRDIDDLADMSTRKREFSRRAETSTPGDQNKEYFHVSDLENKPLDEGREDNAFQNPSSEKSHGALHPFNPYFVDTPDRD